MYNNISIQLGDNLFCLITEKSYTEEEHSFFVTELHNISIPLNEIKNYNQPTLGDFLLNNVPNFYEVLIPTIASVGLPTVIFSRSFCKKYKEGCGTSALIIDFCKIAGDIFLMAAGAHVGYKQKYLYDPWRSSSTSIKFTLHGVGLSIAYSEPKYKNGNGIWAPIPPKTPQEPLSAFSPATRPSLSRLPQTSTSALASPQPQPLSFLPLPQDSPPRRPPPLTAIPSPTSSEPLLSTSPPPSDLYSAVYAYATPYEEGTAYISEILSRAVTIKSQSAQDNNSIPVHIIIITAIAEGGPRSFTVQFIKYVLEITLIHYIDNAAINAPCKLALKLLGRFVGFGITVFFARTTSSLISKLPNSDDLPLKNTLAGTQVSIVTTNSFIWFGQKLSFISDEPHSLALLLSSLGGGLTSQHLITKQLHYAPTLNEDTYSIGNILEVLLDSFFLVISIRIGNHKQWQGIKKIAFLVTTNYLLKTTISMTPPALKSGTETLLNTFCKYAESACKTLDKTTPTTENLFRKSDQIIWKHPYHSTDTNIATTPFNKEGNQLLDQNIIATSGEDKPANDDLY